MSRITLFTSSIIVFIIALTALRYVDRAPQPVERVYAAAAFSEPLHAAQRILIGEKLDINAATEEEFQILVGIGPKRAALIIADRELNGPFTSVYDLTRVHGIGPKTLKKNRHFLTVSP